MKEEKKKEIKKIQRGKMKKTSFLINKKKEIAIIARSTC